MKKFLIGSLVLFGLLFAAGSDASAQPPPPPPTVEARVTALETRLGGIETGMTVIARELAAINAKLALPPPPTVASLSTTLDEFLADQRKEKSQRELADALKCLLNKATPQSYPCGCATHAPATPACQYVKPSCAPISYAPAPCAVWQR